MGNTQAKPAEKAAGKPEDANIKDLFQDDDDVMTPSKTRAEVWKYVSPADADTADGELRLGVLLKYIDAATCVSAEKLAKTYAVTASVDDMIFSDPVFVGESVCIKSQVNRAWNSSMEVGCRVERHVPGVGSKRISKGYFTFVIQKKDVVGGKLEAVVPEDSVDERRFAEAAERRAIRLARKNIVASAIISSTSQGEATSPRGSMTPGKRASHRASRNSNVELFEEDTRRLTQLSSALGMSQGGEQGSMKKMGPINKLLRRKSRRASGGPVDVMTTEQGKTQSISVKSKSCSESAINTVELVLPPHGNHNGTTFGGEIMSWMVEAANLCAMRHCEMKVRPRSVDDVHFMAPSHVGDNIVISAVVTRVFSTFLEVEVTAKSAKFGGEPTHINTCYVTFVAAIGEDDGKADDAVILLPQLVPQSEEESQRHMEALGRRRLALERHALGRGPVLSVKWSADLREALQYSNISSLLRVATAPNDSLWTVISNEKGVKLSVKQSSGDADFLAKMSDNTAEKAPSSVVVVRIEGTVQAPAKDVYDVVRSINKRLTWDPYLQSAQVVSEIDNNNDIVHLTFNTSVGAHDFCLLRSWRAVLEGKYPAFAVASRSVLHPNVPENDGITRGEVLSSGIVVRPSADGKSCTVVQIVQTAGRTLKMGTSELLGQSKMYMETFRGIHRCVTNPELGSRSRGNSVASMQSVHSDKNIVPAASEQVI